MVGKVTIEIPIAVVYELWTSIKNEIEDWVIGMFGEDNGETRELTQAVFKKVIKVLNENGN